MTFTGIIFIEEKRDSDAVVSGRTDGRTIEGKSTMRVLFLCIIIAAKMFHSST